MKIFHICVFIMINVIRCSIIQIPFEYINGKNFIKIKKSKNIISCIMSTLTQKTNIPEDYNSRSKTKRKYEYSDPSLGLFDKLAGKTPVMLYDDWFIIDKFEFMMKYYVDPKIKECIISFSKKQSENERLIDSINNKYKLDNLGLGMKFDEKNENKGILFLGGLPEEEKKGLYSFTYKYSFLENKLSNNDWNFFVEYAVIKVKGQEIKQKLVCPGYIEIGREEIFVPPKFYEILHQYIIGIYIKEKSCDLDNNQLFCYCKDINNINSFERINLNIGGILMEFTVKDSFENRNNRCYLIFKQHTNNYFIFGKNLLKKYKIELLNDKQIKLYSKKNFIFVGISSYNKNKKLLYRFIENHNFLYYPYCLICYLLYYFFRFLLYFIAISCVIKLLKYLLDKVTNGEAKQKVN